MLTATTPHGTWVRQTWHAYQFIVIGYSKYHQTYVQAGWSKDRKNAEKTAARARSYLGLSNVEIFPVDHS